MKIQMLRKIFIAAACIIIIFPIEIFGQEKPVWVDKQPYLKESRYEGFGIASEHVSPDSNRILAHQHALNNLASSFETSVRSTFSDSIRYARENKSESIQQLIQHNVANSINIKLQNVTFEKPWLDRRSNSVHAYVWINREDFRKQSNAYKNVIRDIIKYGNEAENDSKIASVLREYSNALIEMQTPIHHIKPVKRFDDSL